MSLKKIRTLIVDDTVLYRKVMSDLLGAFPELEVVGTAGNGKQTLAKMEALKPDLITLDFEMPVMNGLETLRALKEKYPDVIVVMVATMTPTSAKVTLEALELGAFDFITKPEASSPEASVSKLREQFGPLIRMALMKKNIRQVLAGENKSISSPRPKSASEEILDDTRKRREELRKSQLIELVVIGVSTGGPEALAQVIPALPGDLSVPVLIVQHMPPMFTEALASSLDKKSPLHIVEGVHGMKVKAGQVIIAPGGSHMRVIKIEDELQVLLSDDPPVNFCKPSVDYLMDSLSMNLGGKCLGVIMTGMGNDGVRGLKSLKAAGATILAQDRETCTVYGMPMEAVKAGIVDWELPLDQIASKITTLVQG